MQPGQYFDLALKLVPGRYQLWCSIANHRRLGMQAVLIVEVETEPVEQAPGRIAGG